MAEILDKRKKIAELSILALETARKYAGVALTMQREGNPDYVFYGDIAQGLVDLAETMGKKIYPPSVFED